MEALVNKKVYVGKFSKEIQEKAFRLGFEWQDGYKKIIHLDRPFLFFNERHCITQCNDVEFFNKYSYEEVSPEWILNLPEKKEFKIDIPKDYICNFHITKRGVIIKDFQYYSTEHKWFRQFNSEDEAIAYKYLPTLLYWRDKYNKGRTIRFGRWNSDKRYTIVSKEYEICASDTYSERRLLVFAQKSVRDQFLYDFKELIEKCQCLL